MRQLFLIPLLWVLAAPVWADARAQVLMDVLRIDEVAVILQAEGVEYAETINQDMLGGQGAQAGSCRSMRSITPNG